TMTAPRRRRTRRNLRADILEPVRCPARGFGKARRLEADHAKWLRHARPHSRALAPSCRSDSATDRADCAVGSAAEALSLSRALAGHYLGQQPRQPNLPQTNSPPLPMSYPSPLHSKLSAPLSDI